MPLNDPDESPYCDSCQGKGQAYTEEHDGDMVTQSVKHCEACGGTGLKSADGDVD